MSVHIPEPQLHKEIGVSQHLVPQCYMREWSYNGKDSVWIYDKTALFNAEHPEQSDWIITSKKTDKLNAIDYFHDAKAGDFYMPEDALNELFSFLQSFSISLNGMPLDTLEKLNIYYSEFANWKIYNPDGSEITPSDRQKIQDYLDKSRYTYIEAEWNHQYENNWRRDAATLEQKLRSLKAQFPSGTTATHTTRVITADDLKQVVEYLIIYDWRCRNGAGVIDDILDTVTNIVPALNSLIPSSFHKEDITIKDHFRHQFLLKSFDEFLRTGNGLIGKVIDTTVDKLSIRFCLTDINYPFITSDKPVYVYTRPDGWKEYVFVIRPTLLVSLGRGNKTDFYISNLTHSEVDMYNKATARQGTTLIVPSDTFPISSLLMP